MGRPHHGQPGYRLMDENSAALFTRADEPTMGIAVIGWARFIRETEQKDTEGQALPSIGMGLIHQYQPIIVLTLASRSNNLYRKVRFLCRRENIDSACFHRWPSSLRVSAPSFFHRTRSAEIARASAKAKSLPGTP
jgi:hypothetical protein